MSPDLADRYAEREIATTPEGAWLLADARRAIQEKRWEWADAIGQPHAGWSEGDSFCVARIQELIMKGLVGVVRVDLGEQPAADALRDVNQRVLDTAPEPFIFTLDVAQNCSPLGDGSAGWNASIMVDRCMFEDHTVKWVPARDVNLPLEIGSCRPMTVLMHLARFHGVVRWPYGSTMAWVFIVLDSDAVLERVKVVL